MSATDVTGVQRGYNGYWGIVARNGMRVEIRWTVADDGKSLKGEIRDGTTQESHPVELGLVYPRVLEITQQLGSIDVTLMLVPDRQHISLNCNVPLSINKFFNAPIGEWSVLRRPDDEPSENSLPLIDEPHEAMDLAPFVWLHPATTQEALDASLRFIRLQNPQLLPLYVTLAQCTGADAAIAKQNAAKAFTGLVSDVATLPSPICLFPSLRVQLLTTLSGVQTLPAISQQVENLLGEPVKSLLESPEWASSQASVWQSLFVLALIGTPGNTSLATQLVDVLRVGHFLDLLQQGLPSLQEQQLRNVALNAITAFPDAVATFGLNVKPNPVATTTASTDTGTSASTDTSSTAGSWQVLGPGTLKRARQHLVGYQPGELAEVVNVMPHERQERQEHLLSRREEHDNESTEHRGETDDLRQTSASSELTEALQEIMAADGLVRNMSNVKPTYENLNEILSGAWSGGNGGTSWSGADTSRQVQQLTEKAARYMGDRITRQRGRVWQELCDRRQSNLIDNAGDRRLVGIYHWVDKLMKVHLADAGRRLVFGFVINQPAQAWVQGITVQDDVPLEKPFAIPAFSDAHGLGYIRIKPDNYQALSALYDISDPEPPPIDTLRVITTVNSVVLGDVSMLRIPDGYVAASGTVTMALADTQYNLVCSVAGEDVKPAQAATSSSATTLTVTVPEASSSTTVGNAVVTPPAPPTALVSTVQLASIQGKTGPIPLTVMSAAPLLSVTVDITCNRVVTTGKDHLVVAWQIRSYGRLLEAWQASMQRYQDEFAKRMKLASEDRTVEIQQDALAQACLNLLAPPPGNAQQLQPLFSWSDMNWHYNTQPFVKSVIQPKAIAMASTAPVAERLFLRFLKASAANVLLPVNRGYETRLLFNLQFPSPWIGEPASTPVTESTLMMLEEVLVPDPLSPEQQVPPRHWTVRLPTSMLYLQQGTDLPGFTVSC
ncbi:hypothetical protein SAMN05216598_3029 [Pseudomonas asplenii]|uniref:Uncharacterized protein n=1 Tax=Pseudomonas asplenii TaxID=53407 RepID=A0A1H1VM11_9PSED|nr:hypothetical protein [Pseudomonas asplenii]SDS85918.1 hypothetical protein SAMN05216598_3029 [Pseudomonas asplenii]